MPHSVSVFGSAGFTGALTARLLYRHPSLELRAITARSDVGRRLDDLYPHHRVPLELEELDLDRHADVDAAVVAYPHGAAAPLVAELRERGVRVVDLSADFRLQDPAVYGRWYREHQAPELLGEAVYGLPERYREEIRGASLVANPGCYPTASLLALAPLARAGLIEDVVIDAKSGRVGRRPGRHREDPFRHRRRERERVRRAAPPPHPRDRTGARGIGSRPRRCADHVHSASRAARPGRARQLLRDAVRGDRRTSKPRALYADAYADEPFVELATRPPGVRDVRETNICRISVHRDERTGRVIVFARDRQPVEGRGVAGGAEPQPDARAARGRGDRGQPHAAEREALAVTATDSFFGRAGSRFRATSREPGGGLPRRGSGRPASPAGSSRAASSTSACSSRARRRRRARRGSRTRARSRRRCCCAGSGARSSDIRAIVVNSGNANAATGRPGFENAVKMQGAAALASRCTESAVAVASTGVIGVPLPVELRDHGDRAGDARAPPRRRGRLRARDPNHRRVRQARLPRRRGRRRRRAPDRAGQGRRDDLAELRDAAVLRPDRRGAVARDLRPAARGHG